jgi:hypothetical protein
MPAHTILKTIPSPLNGSETSLHPGTLRQATLTSDQLSMSAPMICGDTPSVISSPALADGPTHSGSPDGLTTDLFGRVHVRVSRSASRVSKRDSTTLDISGPSGESLSASAILQSFLENRLRVRLNGSDLCEVTWKPWAAPWGNACPSRERRCGPPA